MPQQFERDVKSQDNEKTAQYKPPKIVTYNGDDIVEELGPAQTCSPAPGCPVNLP